MESPRPLPLVRSRSGLRNWKNSSKMCCWCSWAIPTPLSFTRISTLPSTPSPASIRTNPWSVNLIALPTRLPRMRDSLMRSMESQIGREGRIHSYARFFARAMGARRPRSCSIISPSENWVIWISRRPESKRAISRTSARRFTRDTELAYSSCANSGISPARAGFAAVRRRRSARRLIALAGVRMS